MGLLVDYVKRFASEAKRCNGVVSRKTISEWFENKEAELKNGYKDVMSFDCKAAVILVGVSGIGKTTYIQNFLNLYPFIKLISYDEAGYQKAEEEMEGKNVSETRSLEIIEEEILKNREESIIVDATLIQAHSRAGLIRTLKDLGYEIHMLYFSKEYTEKNITPCLLNRAIELTLYQDYVEQNKNHKVSMREALNVRKCILERYAKKHGISTQELKTRMMSHPTTLNNYHILLNAYKKEVEENRVWWQEKRGLFFLGADYCYVL